MKATLVVDASALLAVLLNERDASEIEERIVAATHPAMSPVNYWEVLVRIQAEYGEAGVELARRVCSTLRIEVVDAIAEDASVGADAFRRFGKGRPARLNLGDCFAYALSKRTGAPLLYKGNDFRQTGFEAQLEKQKPRLAPRLFVLLKRD